MGSVSRQSDISIVIPTYRREEILLETVDWLRKIDGIDFELILVDQTEHHKPAVEQQLGQLRNDGSIQWLRRSQPSIPGSMNEGARASNGGIVLFLDDDIIPDAGLLDAHRQAHQANPGGLIAGRVLQPWHHDQHDSEPFTRTYGEYKTEFMGGNFSIHRDLLMKLGGFDENFKGAAYHFEREFADRLLNAGYRIWYEPKALIRHLHHSSGGTRSKGDHLTSWNPRHPVGAYYYYLTSPRVVRRAMSMVKRFSSSVFTRHHMRKPWYIPVTLTSELLGLAWAVRLWLKGPSLPFKELESANSAS